MKFWKNNKVLLFEIAIVSLFIIFVALQGGKRFVLDEMDFPTVSKAASHSGRPVWYKGEVTRSQSGLFHPTLYINSLAIFIRTFGFSEMTVRLFGLICAVITSLLLINILKLFNYKNRWGEAILLGIFLLNPYTVACATVPDIDTTVLPITMLLFLYFSLRYFWKKDLSNKYQLLVLSSLFALNLWAKLTTPLMLPAFVFVLLIICKYSIKQSIIKTLNMTLLGALLFFVTYFIYTKAVSLPVSYTFTFLVQSFFKGTSGNQPLTGKIIANAKNIYNMVNWLTIPLTFLYMVSFIGITLDKKFDVESNIIRLLSFFGLAVFIFYMCLISPFGGFFKYPFPVFGLMVMTIVFYFQTKLADIKINKYIAVLVLLVSFIIETLHFRDDAFINHTAFKHLFYLAPLAIVFYGLLYLKQTQKYSKILFIYLLMVVIGFQTGITRFQAKSVYPTKYLYGQQGMNETVGYLKLHTRNDEIIWSMKDVGFYVNDKYYESYPFYFEKKLQPQLEDMLRQGKIRYYVATTGIGEDRIDVYKDIQKILDENATKKATFGNFVIYYSKYGGQETQTNVE